MDTNDRKTPAATAQTNSTQPPERGKTYDSLTGLPSITDFYVSADNTFASPELNDVDFSIVYFNIENMKLYNERFGMGAGDDLLIFVARTIETSFEHVLLTRFGDDRFGLLTYGDDLEEGIARVHASVLEFNDQLRMVIRAGIFAYDHSLDISVACDRAKLACDHIKGRYDVNWYRYEESLLEARNRKQKILNKFSKALDNGDIKVYYQPIFRTIGTRVTEFEALARWIDPVDGFISPGDFIPVLEEFRLIHMLDLRIVELVCQQYSEVLDKGYPIAPANVNLSRYDLELCDIAAETHALMEKYEVPPNMVNIEITESAFEQSGELLRDVIHQFHEYGMQVWMDDFGSGYSSLNVLREYHFDVVKFDMSFLRHRDESSMTKSYSMLPHIVTMMKDLDFQTLAEGVETLEQYEFLTSIGCEKVQGFYFAQPTPIGVFAQRIIAGEFEVETMNQHAYYDLVGHVDLTTPSSIDRKMRQEMELSTGLPAAIVEFNQGKVAYLAWNASYIDYLRDIGMGTIENSTNQMNDLMRPQSQGFFAAAKKMRGVYEWLNLAFYEGDDLCTGRARCIALDEESDRCAFVYIAFNISRFLAAAGHSIPKTVPSEDFGA